MNKPSDIPQAAREQASRAQAEPAHEPASKPIEPPSELTHSLVWLSKRLPQLLPGVRRLHRHEELALCQRVDGARGALDAGALATLVDLVISTGGGRALSWRKAPDAQRLPMVGVCPAEGAFLVLAREADGNWLIESPDGPRQAALPPGARYGDCVSSLLEDATPQGAAAMVRAAVRQHRGSLMMAALATIVINVLALLTSLYSMQVYDRVIPSQGLPTLYALTAGVLLAILLDLLAKFVRSAITDKAVRGIDLDLSHRIFERLLRTRMDQFPASVGSLSAQLRSYESVRSFAMSAALYLLVDAPFAAVFMLAIWLLGGPLVAAVPTAFFLLALGTGLLQRRRIEAHSRSSMAASNRKLGLLVEAVDNAESIKAQGSGWQLLARWNALTRVNVEEDMRVRHLSESAGYFAAFFQQTSYVMLVGTGAYVASTTTDLTSGGVIACSILSGKVLGPIAQLPGLLVQWANAKAAMTGLERIFTLEQDNHGVEQPLTPARVQGAISLHDVKFTYPECKAGVSLDKLEIAPGEKVGLLGVAGAGKSTLLKLLSGMYKPQEGNVMLDQIDLQHIGRLHLSQCVGYLPQEVRLLGGTLRNNLVAGLVGVSDQAVLAACECTGLDKVAARHPKGYELPIAEGGAGVSGGQKQLIGLTRLVLSSPDVWLLDEPTASMDEALEGRAMALLGAAVQPHQTLVLVTHKPALLALVDRLIVLTPDGVALDGPKEVVLQQLLRQSQPAPARPRAVQVHMEEAV